MKEIYHKYCDPNKNGVAKFLTIYIAEAHARDEWWIPHAPNAHEGGRACILQHRNIESRIQAAKAFQEDFDLPFEILCDSIKNEVYEYYDAFPERLYIIENGIITYKGGPGPFDYKLEDVLEWLQSRYGERNNN